MKVVHINKDALRESYRRKELLEDSKENRVAFFGRGEGIRRRLTIRNFINKLKTRTRI